MSRIVSNKIAVYVPHCDKQYTLQATVSNIIFEEFVQYCIVKVSIGHQSQVANIHLGWAQMSNEASHWSFRPRLNGPPWSQMANKS